jgi:hypothetical protein
MIGPAERQERGTRMPDLAVADWGLDPERVNEAGSSNTTHMADPEG